MMNKQMLTCVMLLIVAYCFASCSKKEEKDCDIYFSLIPPTTITNKVNLDMRAGIRNTSSKEKELEVIFYLNEEKPENMLTQQRLTIPPGSVDCAKFIMPTADKVGENQIRLVVKDANNTYKQQKSIKVEASEVRSTKTIDGGWISFYHWSDTEGKMWNPAIKEMTNQQWQEMIASMHKINMDIIVIQESFRNQDYVGKHNIEQEGYQGKAFYPSALYSDRMPLKATDPIEAVLVEADKLGMHVFMGVGMYAWFDYSPGSLEWHKKVAKELWEMYGHHESFYGFYVSEEGMGSLDCFETEEKMQIQRRQEVLNFFKEFTPFCAQLAPGKPVMFAPNGWGVGRSQGAYPELLKNVDIICPFAFARMPEGDLTGEEAVNTLQKYCDDAGAHLWLDLEAFLFDEAEGYLYPRPIDEITTDLNMFNNFEKVICYQYPGVFSDPDMSFLVGEERTIDLFNDYVKYMQEVKGKN